MTLEPMIHIASVGWDDPAAAALREAMSVEMRLRYADRLAVRVPSPSRAVAAETVVYTGVAYAPGGVPVGHAALRRLGDDLELKRMYVAPSHRGRRVAARLLTAVDQTARRLDAARIVLQTGDRQPDAERVYVRGGYTRIPIFPPYEELTYSRCFQKILVAQETTRETTQEVRAS